MDPRVLSSLVAANALVRRVRWAAAAAWYLLIANSPRHLVNCDKQCRGGRTTAYRTYGARGHTKA